MRVKRLVLQDFRGIQDASLYFEPASTTLIYGDNGCGKTSILEALSIMVSRLIGRIRTERGTGRFFTEYDITNGTTYTSNEITILFDGEEISWRVVKHRKGGDKQKITHQQDLKELARRVQERLQRSPASGLPIAVYYAVNRAVLDVPIRIRKKHGFEPLAAYDLALSGKRNDFRSFFAWFRGQEDIENEEKSRRRDLDYRDPQLEAVREAIYRLIPGFSDLRVERKPLRMVVTKSFGESHDYQKLFINQLSDGEKCMLALAGDIARRLAMANPSLDQPLQGRGIVMIDEIDLHLHPGWQRNAIPSLETTFPNIQLVATTHSPQVLSSAKSSNVFFARSSEKGIEIAPVRNPYGSDTNRILEENMSVPERPEPVKRGLRRLFQLIAEGAYGEAQSLRMDLERDIGSDEPLFARLDAILWKKGAIAK
jgi:predicted ATP-binding protein involved in virulence